MLLFAALGIWYLNPTHEMTYVYLIISAQLLLGVIEHYLPARPEWAVLAKEKSINILVAFPLTLIALTLTTIYVELLAEASDAY